MTIAARNRCQTSTDKATFSKYSEKKINVGETLLLVEWGNIAMADEWPTRRFAVASVHLDQKNPRLGRETSARAPREIVQYLFDHDDALEVAQSIAIRGYFPNEPLLGIREDNRIIVVEGNRRLASLKALREPGLLEGSKQRAI